MERKNKKIIFGISFIILVMMIVVCLMIGTFNVSFHQLLKIFQALFTHNQTYLDDNLGSIIINVRLPRVLLVGLVGASLSLAGVATQGLLKNSLADTSILGIASGGCLGAIIAIAFNLQIPGLENLTITIFSIIFAFMTLLFVLWMATKINKTFSSNTIILVGIMVSMVGSSLISLIITIFPEKFRSIVFWTMGSFSGKAMPLVVVMVPFFIIGTLGLLWHYRELNALAIGEQHAQYLGVNLKKIKIKVLVYVSILVGASVAVSGTIGFVGLVIPHMTRLIVGQNHRYLLPFSAMFGSIFLLAMDLISRTIVSPTEIPIGIVTSLIGSVLFIKIFYSSQFKGGY